MTPEDERQKVRDLAVSLYAQTAAMGKTGIIQNMRFALSREQREFERLAESLEHIETAEARLEYDDARSIARMEMADSSPAEFAKIDRLEKSAARDPEESVEEFANRISASSGDVPAPGMKVSEKLALWFALAAVVFVGYQFVQGMPSEEEKAANWKLVSARGWVKDRLKDPDSADFGRAFLSSSGAVCGTVNARNSFGGYTGNQRFVGTGPQSTFLESEIPQADFEDVWAQFCAKK